MRSIRSLCALAWVLALAACLNSTDPAYDGSAPQVRIDAPLSGATVSAQVAIDVTAVDDFGVDKVRVLIDGVVLTEMFTPPFHTVFNTLSVTNNAPHTIRVEALDVAGNVGSAQIQVMVQNGVQAPPAVPR